MRLSRRLTGIQAFYTLTAGQFVSTIGSGMTRFGLGIWVLKETGDTTAYTLLLFFAVFPIGLGSFVSGPFIDRLDRRRVMLIANMVASFSTLVIAILYFSQVLQVWHLYLALFVNGIANAFILPALDSSVPLLVTKDQLGRASGLTQLVQSLETILSPSLAGFVIGFLNIGAIFIIDFVTFSASIIALFVIDIPKPKIQSVTERTNLIQDFVLGLQYIRQQPAFIYLLGLFSITMFLLPGVAYSLVTPMVLNFASEQAVGLITSAFGVGSLVGGILLGVWGGPRQRVLGILIAMSMASFATIVIAWRENVFLIAVGFFITGISFVFIMGLNRVIWQTKAKTEMLGRVFALQIALGVISQSAGILLTGPLAQTVFEPLMKADGALASTFGGLLGLGDGRGMAVMFILVGLTQLMIVVFSLLVPSIRNLEHRIPDKSMDLNTQHSELASLKVD